MFCIRYRRGLEWLRRERLTLSPAVAKQAPPQKSTCALAGGSSGQRPVLVHIRSFPALLPSPPPPLALSYSRSLQSISPPTHVLLLFLFLWSFRHSTPYTSSVSDPSRSARLASCPLDSNTQGNGHRRQGVDSHCSKSFLRNRRRETQAPQEAKQFNCEYLSIGPTQGILSQCHYRHPKTEPQ